MDQSRPTVAIWLTGPVAGSLLLARYAWAGVPVILTGAAALAVMQIAVAAADGMVPLLASVFAYGVSAGLFCVTVINTMQSHTMDAMRGRAMAVYSVAFLGSGLLGGPVFGALDRGLRCDVRCGSGLHRRHIGGRICVAVRP